MSVALELIFRLAALPVSGLSMQYIDELFKLLWSKISGAAG